MASYLNHAELVDDAARRVAKHVDECSMQWPCSSAGIPPDPTVQSVHPFSHVPETVVHPSYCLTLAPLWERPYFGNRYILADRPELPTI